MFGISGGEFFVILLVIVLVVGPQRLPEYTRKLTQLVRQLRLFIESAKEQIAEEVGPELADLNLKDLDPRNYDPRKIVRDALGEDLDAIRRDLANPFQSVISAGKEASDEAAAAVNKETGAEKRSKSLSQMIEDKAEETRQTQAGASGDSIADAVPPVEAEGASEAGAGSGEEAAEAEPAEAPAATEASDGSEAAQSPEDEGSSQPAESADSAEDASDASVIEAENGAAQAADDAEATEPAAGGESAKATEPGESVPSEDAAEAATETRTEAAAKAAGIPSSLVEADTSGDGAAAASTSATARPISPRDIVRAANKAARTRAEARETVVSV